MDLFAEYPVRILLELLDLLSRPLGEHFKKETEISYLLLRRLCLNRWLGTAIRGEP